jgi:hypothetical protein
LIIRYYIDPESGQPHIYKHQVDEVEVEEVLRRPGEDRPGQEDSRVAIGKTDAGRYLRIIYVLEPGGVFVITAYELRGKPLLAYRRRMRKRKRR